MSEHLFRKLPSVTALLELFPVADGCPHDHVVQAIRSELASLRSQITQGTLAKPFPSLQELANSIRLRIQHAATPALRPVINATGIVLHTNLGRAPMAHAAVAAALESAHQYCSLEYDLYTGKRRSRQHGARELLCRLTGAPSATVVNNCAAATVLTLSALASGCEVIVSRGQLIEIGGSFRLPEIMTVSGARLREVGTTNIARLQDYERAISPETGLIMRVHPSNYRVRGFTREVGLAELVTLGRKHGIPVVDDIGSGAMLDFSAWGCPGEPIVHDSLSAGADIVLFSGDKLLGGPQAGFILGRKDLIDRVEKHPLMRAFRLDKMVLAALDATLRLYADPALACEHLPVLKMLSLPLPELESRSLAFANRLRDIPGLQVDVQPSKAYVGGGSLPDVALPTWVIALESSTCSEEEFAMQLRQGSPPVVARIQHQRLLIDLRTVFPDQQDSLLQAIQTALTVAG